MTYFSTKDKAQFVLQYVLARASILDNIPSINRLIDDANTAWEAAWKA